MFRRVQGLFFYVISLPFTGESPKGQTDKRVAVRERETDKREREKTNKHGDFFPWSIFPYSAG